MYATGASQTGGFLRDFLYLGFNEDEAHRRVFDGVIPTIAGTDRVFINVRFADPNVYSGQDDRHDFLQNSHPPFTYAVVTDPLTGIHDGILKRPATDPLLFHVDSATEFWQLRASLNVVDANRRHGAGAEERPLLFRVEHVARVRRRRTARRGADREPAMRAAGAFGRRGPRAAAAGSHGRVG